jgi:hypothetical protein
VVSTGVSAELDTELFKALNVLKVEAGYIPSRNEIANHMAPPWLW